MKKENVSNSSEEFIFNLCATSFKIILDDDVWRSFGYKNRPKRGAFFNKFINKNTVLAEKFLAREIFIFSFSSGLSALPYDWTYTLIQKIKFRLFEVLMADRNLMAAFDFKSEREMVKYFCDGFDSYIEHDYEDFLKIFYERAKNKLNELFNSAWIVGGATLYTGASKMIYYTTKNNYEYLEDDIIFQNKEMEKLF